MLGLGPILDLVDAKHVPVEVALGKPLLADGATELRMLRRPLATILRVAVIQVLMALAAVGTASEVVLLSGLGWKTLAALGARNLKVEDPF